MSTAIMETIELIAPGANLGSTLLTTLMQTTHPESSATLDSQLDYRTPWSNQI